MNYSGRSENVRVRIVAKNGWLSRYFGQECDVTLYEGGINPQIDTEQLTPPLPRWQSCKAEDIERIADELERRK